MYTARTGHGRTCRRAGSRRTADLGAIARASLTTRARDVALHDAPTRVRHPPPNRRKLRHGLGGGVPVRIGPRRMQARRPEGERHAGAPDQAIHPIGSDPKVARAFGLHCVEQCARVTVEIGQRGLDPIDRVVCEHDVFLPRSARTECARVVSIHVPRCRGPCRGRAYLSLRRKPAHVPRERQARA